MVLSISAHWLLLTARLKNSIYCKSSFADWVAGMWITVCASAISVQMHICRAHRGWGCRLPIYPA